MQRCLVRTTLTHLFSIENHFSVELAAVVYFILGRHLATSRGLLAREPVLLVLLKIGICIWKGHKINW